MYEEILTGKTFKQSMYIKYVSNATIIFIFFHFHLTQHVSALNLQVSESVETATLHQCALKSHTLQSI
jgi:hypothetical protein